MKLTLAAVLLCAFPAWAADFETPRASPYAKTEQTVGLTDITIDYSSPGVKGRKVWGELVPYGQVWRTGANKATKITFSKDVVIGTTPVPAGSYAFFAVPTADAWTLILNKDFNQGGAFNYKKELDVARVDVKPEAITPRERLAYTVTDFNDDQANISLEWEKVRVSLPVKLGTEAQLSAAIKAVDGKDGEVDIMIANYYLGKKDNDDAVAWADKALKVKETWFGDWVKAQALAAKGKKKDALTLAQKAQTLGSKDEKNFFAQDNVKKALVDWKK